MVEKTLASAPLHFISAYLVLLTKGLVILPHFYGTIAAERGMCLLSKSECVIV